MGPRTDLEVAEENLCPFQYPNPNPHHHSHSPATASVHTDNKPGLRARWQNSCSSLINLFQFCCTLKEGLTGVNQITVDRNTCCMKCMVKVSGIKLHKLTQWAKY